MTWRHIFGLCFVFATVVFCGFSSSCHDQLPTIKDLALVAIGGIVGDANGSPKTRPVPKRTTGTHMTLDTDQGSDGQ